MSEGRTYTLAPRDETGWVFGMSLPQLAAVGLAGAIALVALRTSPPAGAMVMIIGAFVAFGRLNGIQILEMIPVGMQWIRDWPNRREPWFVRVPVISDPKRGDACRALADQEILLVDASEYEGATEGDVIVISHDTRVDSYGVTLRVMGREFSLLDGGERDRMAEGWATALQGFVSERTTVASIRWSEWVAPAGLADHREWLRDHLADDPLEAAVNSYQRLLAESGSQSTRHETLVTLTIDAGTAKVRSKRANRSKALIDALLTEARLFTRRLEGAGLVVGGPLNPSEWARAMRLRFNPSSRAALDTRTRALGNALRAVDPAKAGPSSAASYWKEWVTDDSIHRSFYVSEWPRTEVMADWMTPLLLYNGCVRTVSVIYEPIPRYVSHRSIKRSSTKIEADTESRMEKGLRIGASYSMSKDAVEARDSELVAGYGELSYTGLVTVTAESDEELEDVSEEIVQVAASIGMELRPLHGRHADAFCATLPLARSVRRRWML